MDYWQKTRLRLIFSRLLFGVLATTLSISAQQVADRQNVLSVELQSISICSIETVFATVFLNLQEDDSSHVLRVVNLLLNDPVLNQLNQNRIFSFWLLAIPLSQIATNHPIRAGPNSNDLY